MQRYKILCKLSGYLQQIKGIQSLENMSDDKRKPTQIATIGEFGLINKLTAGLKSTNASTYLGVGDDAAVLNYGEKQIVTSMNVLNEGIHFNLVYFPLKHLGYKAVVSTISNIYAMNAIPRQMMVGISLSGKFSVEAIEELYTGIKAACQEYEMDLVGGDTNSSLTGLSICMAAYGESRKEQLVYRNGAQINDLICVSGDLGAAYLGLQLLERERAVYEENRQMQPELSGFEYILSRQLKPEARKDIINHLMEKKIQPTSMIDISDGLASDIMHICMSSGVGCTIYQDRIPIDTATQKAAEEFHLEPTTCALNGGDDFELLFTVPVKHYEDVKNVPGITIIGHVTSNEDGRKLVTINDEAVELVSKGWGEQ